MSNDGSRVSRPKVTQQQIAELAGVSHVAVSYALHRPHLARISADKQREIHELAARLGYQPRRMTTRAIGLFINIDSLKLSSVTNLIAVVNEVLTDRQYSLLLLVSERQRQEPFTIIEKHVDGVLVFGDLASASRLLPETLPQVVLADTDPDQLGPDLDLVTLDTTQMTRQATDYLLGLGHRRFCLILGDSENPYHSHLEAGLRAAATADGVPPSSIQLIKVRHNHQIPEALPKVLAKADSPTAILTASSGKATSALSVLQDMGLRLPRDVSLLSLGDNESLSALRPTVSACLDTDPTIVTKAVDQLIARIKKPGRRDTPLRLVLPGSLIIRDSTGPAPAPK